MAANATAIWRVRPSGNDNNGGGFDTGIASFGTDYSQQNAAQVTQSGGTVSTATVTLTDTGASFTSALIGNGIRVAGTGITTTYTFITAVPSSTTLTLQTSPGTTGTSVTYSIGGGWATIHTNMTTSGPVVPGNIIYVLGSGIPNPSSYVYDYVVTNAVAVNISGNTTAGNISWIIDSNTPSYKAPPDTTGGMPTIQLNGNGAYQTFSSLFYLSMTGFWFVGDGGASIAGSSIISFIGCVADAFGFINNYLNSIGGGIIGCEAYDLTGANSGGSISTNGGVIDSCNVHDCVGGSANSGIIKNSIFAKNAGDGVQILENQTNATTAVVNCTIDGNGGNGIFNTGTSQPLSYAFIYNNIISNHTTAGKYGFNGNTSTTAVNDRLKQFIDYNTYYNNNANYNVISAGPHDTALGADPYVGSTTENYTLK